MPRTNPRIIRYEFSIDTFGELDQGVIANIKKYMDNFSPVGKSYVSHYDVPIELTPLIEIPREVRESLQPNYTPFDETDIGRWQATPVAPEEETIPY